MTNETSPIRQRISCAGLCRIQDGHGRYLLGLNLDRFKQGLRVYTPLGGALRYYNPAILDRFHAIPEDPGTCDLRMLIDATQVDAFREWFITRQERETSVFRELYEELVDEFRLLDHLAPGAVQVRFCAIYEHQGITGRGAANGTFTHYFHDIFEIHLIDPILRDLLASAERVQGLRWFTEAEILHGTTDDDAVVDGKALLL
jgi:hypothetical protein